MSCLNSRLNKNLTSLNNLSYLYLVMEFFLKEKYCPGFPKTDIIYTTWFLWCFYFIHYDAMNSSFTVIWDTFPHAGIRRKYGQRFKSILSVVTWRDERLSVDRKQMIMYLLLLYTLANRSFCLCKETFNISSVW